MKAYRFAVLLFAAVSPAASHAAAIAPDGYQVVQSIPLRGCACKAEILEDARLTQPMRDVLAGIGVIYPKDEPLFKDFDKAPMKNAAIRIVGPKGKVLDHRDFDVPLANLRDKPLALGIPKDAIYSLEVDRSRGELYFSGPAYYFFSVRGGRFDWVHSVDQATRKRYELVPTINARNEFSLVDRIDRKGKDFLLLRCDFKPAATPGQGTGTYTTAYTRIHFEGGEWRARRETKPGDHCRGDQ